MHVPVDQPRVSKMLPTRSHVTGTEEIDRHAAGRKTVAAPVVLVLSVKLPSALVISVPVVSSEPFSLYRLATQGGQRDVRRSRELQAGRLHLPGSDHVAAARRNVLAAERAAAAAGPAVRDAARRNAAGVIPLPSRGGLAAGRAEPGEPASSLLQLAPAASSGEECGTGQWQGTSS